MDLKNIVPWGRSYSEYADMFCLSSEDIEKSILGCGDGPASFNAELTERGGSVVSVDPIYRFSEDQLKSRISEVYEEIMPQMESEKDKYVWDNISSVSELGRIRMSSMNKFLSDYELGKAQQRYVHGSLPVLPFEDCQFELALCSHFLFLYSEQVSLQQHLDSMNELTRVANEVRVYPLVTLKGQSSTHLNSVIDMLSERGIDSRLIDSGYVFQKGATKTLVVKSS